MRKIKKYFYICTKYANYDIRQYVIAIPIPSKESRFRDSGICVRVMMNAIII